MPLKTFAEEGLGGGGGLRSNAHECWHKLFTNIRDSFFFSPLLHDAKNFGQKYNTILCLSRSKPAKNKF